MGDGTTDNETFVMELAGERMLSQCKEGDKEPTTSNGGCADFEKLYDSIISC